MTRQLTRIFIIVSVLIWIAYDAWTYLKYGNPSTESAVLVRLAWYHPWMPFVVGGVIGHIFFDLREPIDWPKDTSKD